MSSNWHFVSGPGCICSIAVAGGRCYHRHQALPHTGHKQLPISCLVPFHITASPVDAGRCNNMFLTTSPESVTERPRSTSKGLPESRKRLTWQLIPILLSNELLLHGDKNHWLLWAGRKTSSDNESAHFLKRCFARAPCSSIDAAAIRPSIFIAGHFLMAHLLFILSGEL